MVEYRRLLPALVKAGLPAYAVDVIGWGFTDAGFAADPSILLGPEQKRKHLYAFWKEKVRVHWSKWFYEIALQPMRRFYLSALNGFPTVKCPAMQIKKPMVVAGVSLGGAVALDFAVSHPEAVSKLVLVDAQVSCGCLAKYAQLIL